MRSPDRPELPVVRLSHRGPVSFGRDQSGRTASRGAGGLVTALTGLVAGLPDAVWVCAASFEEDAAVAAEHDRQAVPVALDPEPRLAGGDRPEGGGDGQAATVRLRLVEVDRRAHDDFYTVIANPLLWFLQHGMYGLALDPQLTRREHAAWQDGYVAVNRRVAEAVAEEVTARGGHALVMLHDYHFYLVGAEVRERCPEALLSFFLHIPWPGPDAWRVLPPAWREQVLGGLLGNDVVAFHTEGFARNFLLCAQELLGLPVDLEAMTVEVGDRLVRARHYPISIDVAAMREQAASADVAAHADALNEAFCGGDRQLVLRVDRTDPSKNIVRGFLAFGTLLEDHPELVAKEAVVVNGRDGVLALSENTGAHQELGAFAVTLHPFDIQQQADALFAALTMDRGLRRARREAAAAVVAENDIAKWLGAQLSDLRVEPAVER